MTKKNICYTKKKLKQYPDKYLFSFHFYVRPDFIKRYASHRISILVKLDSLIQLQGL